ncbi:MAG: hypothetical protein OXD29_09075 [Roseovarius sp.]|nr:hypothetical protein [Roseovarius sp.]
MTSTSLSALPNKGKLEILANQYPDVGQFHFVFVDFYLVLQEFLHLCGKKKSSNISFFMEEGMVCEKQKLAGITGHLAI